jgi:hypothetical protein
MHDAADPVEEVAGDAENDPDADMGLRNPYGVRKKELVETVTGDSGSEEAKTKCQGA